MSCPIIRRNSEGVLLFYPDPTTLRAFHDEEKAHGGDREKCAVVRACISLAMLELVIECLNIDDEWEIKRAFGNIQMALTYQRRALGMCAP